MSRRYLKATFDVTGLTDEQVGQLQLEVAVQAERSDGHPGVPEPEIYVYEDHE